MKFKIDENLPVEIIDEIRGLGQEAHTVIYEGLKGFVDPEILAAAKRSGCVLLTMGIANVRLHPPEQFEGIVPFRPKRAGRRTAFGFVRRHLSALVATKLLGRPVIVSKAGIRVR